MRRYKEPVKTALLLLLTLSAAFLAWRGNLFAGLFPGAEPPASPAQEEILSCQPAALPAEAALTGLSGLRYGVKYDEGGMSSLFDACSPLLAEALGSAEEPAPISEEVWRSRLGGAGLYLNYGFSLPLSVLAAWAGGEAAWAGSRTATALLLMSDGDDGIRLCFRSGEGTYYSGGTASSWLSLQELLNAFFPNGAAFAFELPELGDCDPDSLVLEEPPTPRSATASGSQAEAAAALAEQFGINLSGQSRYSEADGTLVYPGEGGVLRLDAEGTVSYTASEGKLGGASGTAEQVEAVRRLLWSVHDACAGDEKLALTDLRREEGVLRLSFAYVLDGIPVQLNAGPAASAEWGPEGFRELTVLPRRYRRGETGLSLLPEKQAAAAAGSLYPGSSGRLILSDRGERSPELIWAVTLEGRLLWTQEG